MLKSLVNDVQIYLHSHLLSGMSIFESGQLQVKPRGLFLVSRQSWQGLFVHAEEPGSQGKTP